MAPGESRVLAEYHELRGCQPLAAPHLQLTRRPALGSATVMRAETTLAAAGCAPLRVSVTRVVYRAAQPGEDEIAWTVRYQGRGRAPQHEAARIRVQP
ncbi:Uncharacterised protein [Bordetella trematum]|uniref:Uncharacterized protein n=1 Tax=Bordetella trematum TaxID=123899 RepID=A0A157SLP5_9BORD|nr:hypothetical protein [Bordetella trematum]NNH17541.1 hypothetical protein [Bordetella trematum]SAI60535.1 Uncharacterised protein [Bordetella trematum]SAI71388.1 Uncharacterised protein [Bordetella trematum]SUV98264.1 Uncharacterised protein [Bordetella trematum]